MRILLSAIYPFAFLLLYLIIPFDNYIRVLPNILVAVLVIAFPFVVKKDDFKKLKSLPILAFFGLIVYLLINSYFAGRFEEDITVINKVMVALGLAVLYIPVSDMNPSSGWAGKINSAIIFSALAAIIFSVYNFVLITDATGSFSLGESPQVVESLLIDRLYLGMLSTFSILISFQAIKKKYHPNNNYYLANILINAIFIVLMASKIAMVTLFLLLLVRQFYGQRKIWKVAIALGAMAAVVVLFFIIKSDTDFETSIKESKNNPPAFIENSLTYELRAVVWGCAQQIINEDEVPFNGIGFYNTKEKLVACYDSQILNPEKRKRFTTKRYNTHNQFLDFYLSAGFIALLLFLAFICFSFLSFRKQFFPTAMLTILVVYCMVENVFHRQIGAYYLGYIIIALTSSANHLKNNKAKIE
ncbi:O-antigen ligase family protein [Aequorivita xiaoshiensis]|uniref:O-antigen ligase family protein n=1 Tax=Aequorivita xiaoshiensis TaxID=2874476 RepID=A0A9X1QWW1_9FLAO|nr:O-antigen ligase family protein [Aequorivita xiaoshiensis]MCG2429981.1 O-antigen ligase family protein [Aequorivita xiaoshiensis]